MKRKLCYLLEICYFLLLIYMVFLKNTGSDSPYTYSEYISNMHNFIPFLSVYNLITTPVLSMDMIKQFIINVVGNILLFFPFGILEFDWMKGKIVKTIAWSFVIIVLIECIQLFFCLGIFDVDDIILNMIGVILGMAAKATSNRIQGVNDK